MIEYAQGKRGVPQFVAYDGIPAAHLYRLGDLLCKGEPVSELKLQRFFDSLEPHELALLVTRAGELHGRAHVELERRERAA